MAAFDQYLAPSRIEASRACAHDHQRTVDDIDYSADRTLFG
jgi:hypothetical protein